MRQLQFKPKVAKRVTTPEDLKDFFRYVNSLIESGDSAAVNPSDDLIQSDRAYGGLTEEGTDQFAFTYFPGSHIRPCWEIEATAGEIRSIVLEATSLDLWSCADPLCGNLFAGPDGVCFYCDYKDDARDARDAIMPELANSSNREEWVRGYLKHFPDDHPMQIIGAYNGQPNLGKKLGWLTTEEIERIITDAQQ